MREFSYEFSAKQIREMAFNNIKQIDQCIDGYDDDLLSRIIWGNRQGQITRFEYMLLAGMGDNYVNLHPWNNMQWFVDRVKGELSEFRRKGIEIRNYVP